MNIGLTFSVEYFLKFRSIFDQMRNLDGAKHAFIEKTFTLCGELYSCRYGEQGNDSGA